MTTTDTVRTARGAGAAYLGLGITGMLGFLVLRPQLFTDSPAQTLANLADQQALAHTVVALEMGIVITQALAAIWFYRLLRDVRPVAGFAVATFGLMNAAAIMASGAFMITAVTIAGDPSLVEGADAAGTVSVLATLSESSWAMGTIFFGLWLIPMGWAAITTRRFPVVLGWLLVAGGVGYVLSGLLGNGVANAPTWLAEGLAYPATVAEFWMIGYLLIVGIRPRTVTAPTRTPVKAAA
ncbi:DUF4386 domain-containing protein [Demequina activiva]|uniref:DUF4386 domain-containing protein n=1 Tax=Demequina activiva TaxID=1582364 RepID=A0A919Q3Y7_9MICO|nr:DUF4386 domain-containing protein [Demequina activiva]GIG55624.1 hypothetical protein Dac01nite_23760 [Demequina activiva]